MKTKRLLMETKDVVYIAVVASLYAVFTIVLAPISYGAIQFRVSEMFKVFVLLNPLYAVGIGIGTFIGNIMSPYAGIWDLVFMPLTDIIGGVLAYYVFKSIKEKSIFPSMVLYAITTGLSVGIMLSFFGLGYWYIVCLPIILSELIVLVIGAPILWKAMKWMKINSRN